MLYASPHMKRFFRVFSLFLIIFLYNMLSSLIWRVEIQIKINIFWCTDIGAKIRYQIQMEFYDRISFHKKRLLRI